MKNFTCFEHERVKLECNGLKFCKFDVTLDRSLVNNQKVIDVKFDDLKGSLKKCQNVTTSGSQNIANAEIASETTNIKKWDSILLAEGFDDVHSTWEWVFGKIGNMSDFLCRLKKK